MRAVFKLVYNSFHYFTVLFPLKLICNKYLSKSYWRIFQSFCTTIIYYSINNMGSERLVESLRHLLCTNISGPGGLRDNSGNLITVDQKEFPGVDCSEVFPNLFLGNG